MKLSVLDQVPVRQGEPLRAALSDAVAIAKAAEGLGYKRYWMAEHHNAASLACTCPEIAIAPVAAQTSRIRVGAGGIMLTHYSALKVAEQFATLVALFPQRIDLGIGRARGCDAPTAERLAYPRPVIDPILFPEQVRDVLGYLEWPDGPGAAATVKAQVGQWSDRPEVWILGSGPDSARLAGDLGLPFCFAVFIGRRLEDAAAALAVYRGTFKASTWRHDAYASVALGVICAPRRDEAQYLASSALLDRLGGPHGASGLLPPDEASRLLRLPQYQDRTSAGEALIVGTQDDIAAAVTALSSRCKIDELFVLCNCYALSDRTSCLRLVAEALVSSPTQVS